MGKLFKRTQWFQKSEKNTGNHYRRKRLPYAVSLLAFILIAAFGLCGIPPCTIYASDVPDHIRIGLTYKYKSADTVPVRNQTVAAGYEINGQFFEAAVLSSATGFSVNCVTAGYYVKLDQAYPDYQAAQSAAEAMKARQLSAVPCLTGVGAWAVYIGGYPAEADAAAAKNQLPEAAQVIQPGGKSAVLTANAAAVVLFDSPEGCPQLKAADGTAVDLGDRKYRGRIEFGRYNGGKLTAVNILTMEEYLYSAVPSEMPSAWPMEALKSQACAARNYAVVNHGKHGDAGYDLCDSIHCQVYWGAGNEADSTTQAVNATAGQLIRYNSAPIDAVFFSSSGGATDDSEQVWANSVPYLRSVREINEPMAKQWIRVIPLADLNKALTANNANIGSATGMLIGSYNAAGKVSELIITGTNGNKALHKEEIRSFFSSLSGGSLESRNFSIATGTAAGLVSQLFVSNGQQTVQPQTSALTAVNGQNAQTALAAGSGMFAVLGSSGIMLYAADAAQMQNAGTDIIITGNGWGHGVGMSQFGAKGMAELGYTYDQILKHYYTGVEIQ